MNQPRTFRDLIVWQKSIGLTRVIYEMTHSFPDSERFGITNQMRRAAVSIPSNIAEGNARVSRKDYIRLLIISRGSLAELETQVVIARELGYMSNTTAVMIAMAEISRMLQALIASLRKKSD